MLVQIYHSFLHTEPHYSHSCCTSSAHTCSNHHSSSWLGADFTHQLPYISDCFDYSQHQISYCQFRRWLHLFLVIHLEPPDLISDILLVDFEFGLFGQFLRSPWWCCFGVKMRKLVDMAGLPDSNGSSLTNRAVQGNAEILLKPHIHVLLDVCCFAPWFAWFDNFDFRWTYGILQTLLARNLCTSFSPCRKSRWCIWVLSHDILWYHRIHHLIIPLSTLDFDRNQTHKLDYSLWAHPIATNPPSKCGHTQCIMKWDASLTAVNSSCRNCCLFQISLFWATWLLFRALELYNQVWSTWWHLIVQHRLYYFCNLRII